MSGHSRRGEEPTITSLLNSLQSSSNGHDTLKEAAPDLSQPSNLLQMKRISTIQCHQNGSNTPHLDAFRLGVDSQFQNSPSTRKPYTYPSPRPKQDVPPPGVTAPRNMRAGQARGRKWTDGLFPDLIRKADGNQTSSSIPTMRGPGTDHRLQAKGQHTYLQDMQRQDIYPTLVPDTHRELMETAIPQEARDSLRTLGQSVHDPFNKGAGDYNIDEYSMVMDQLPKGFDTPEQFLQSFLEDPNGFANDQSASWNPLRTEGLVNDFDFYNQFTLNQAGSNKTWASQNRGDRKAAPGVGDWYHIDIPGNDGDVMIVDSQDNKNRTAATVQTMTDQEFGPGNDNHPVSGRRQFGMEQLKGGGHRFYTRGFDRQTSGLMDPQVSNQAQHADWSCLMRAMAEEHGGRAERTDANGDPMWGWARQLPLDTLTSSMVESPVAHDK